MNIRLQNEFKSPIPNERKISITSNSEQLGQMPNKEIKINNNIHSFKLQREMIKTRTTNHSAKSSFISDSFFAPDSTSTLSKGTFKEEYGSILSNISSKINSNLNFNFNLNKTSNIAISKILNSNTIYSTQDNTNSKIKENKNENGNDNYPNSQINHNRHEIPLNEKTNNSSKDGLLNVNIPNNLHDKISDKGYHFKESQKSTISLRNSTNQGVFSQTKNYNYSINSNTSLKNFRSESHDLKSKEKSYNVIHTNIDNKEINVAPIINNNKKIKNTNLNSSHFKNEELCDSSKLFYTKECVQDKFNINPRINNFEESRVIVKAKKLKQNLEKYIFEFKKEDTKINEENYHSLINLMHNISTYLNKNSNSIVLHSKEFEKLDFIHKTLNLISANSSSSLKKDANILNRSIFNKCNNKKNTHNFSETSTPISDSVQYLNLKESSLKRDEKQINIKQNEKGVIIKNIKDKYKK